MNNNEYNKILIDKIGKFYDWYKNNSFDLNTNYDKPIISNKDIKNSIIKFNDDNEISNLINTFFENMHPNTNKVLMLDFDYMNFSFYNGMPHLLAPIITERNKISQLMNAVYNLIEVRYETFLTTRTKGIDQYNLYVESLKGTSTQEEQIYNKMPYITIFISDIYTVMKEQEFQDVLTQSVLKGETAGIKFILFTKFKLSSIDLGNIGQFFKLYRTCNPNNVFSLADSADENIVYNENMDGYEFEKFCKELLIANGFSDVEVTSSSHDFGVDVIAYNKDIKYAIQCKKYSQKVGLQAVQEVIASKSIHKCHVAVVLTNNYFTKSAIELAEKNNVLLWDKNKLDEMLKKANN